MKNIKKEEASCNGKECIKYPDDQWLKDIIMVLLLNEIYRRRQKEKDIIKIKSDLVLTKKALRIKG